MKCRPADQEPTNRPGVLAGVVPDRRGSATAYGAPWETPTGKEAAPLADPFGTRVGRAGGNEPIR